MSTDRNWDLVIFDNDGVLVDSEVAANEIMAALLTEAGVPTTFEDSVRRFLGRGLPACRELVRSEDGVELPPEFEERYLGGVYDVFRTTLRPVPGILEVIGAAKDRGIARCVASSGGHERIRLALTTTGLAAHFGADIFSADDVGRGKPWPDLFLHAAEEMGVHAERCVVIEDSPAGISAAHAAGMASIGLARLLSPAVLVGATHVVRHAAEIPELLGAER